MKNKLVLIGNGFDLAHGLKTSYKDFLDWYICNAYKEFRKKKYYNDRLIEIETKYPTISYGLQSEPNNFSEVLNSILATQNQSLNYHSNFFKSLLNRFTSNRWIDIECFYFKTLKVFFSNSNISKEETVSKLNSDFDFLIKKLTEYITKINLTIFQTRKLPIDNSRFAIKKLFGENNDNRIKFLNFNYTETLHSIYNITQEEIIHIHGRVADIDRNPIIFGYGDEGDPDYQKIEDSDENLYLDNIKSFGYFRTKNYEKLLLFLDSDEYEVSIVGHSCGLSDRVLLNEIFENSNPRESKYFFTKEVMVLIILKKLLRKIQDILNPLTKE
jgi:hypothetical protein